MLVHAGPCWSEPSRVWSEHFWKCWSEAKTDRSNQDWLFLVRGSLIWLGLNQIGKNFIKRFFEIFRKKCIGRDDRWINWDSRGRSVHKEHFNLRKKLKLVLRHHSSRKLWFFIILLYRKSGQKLDQAVKILNQEIVYQVATKISKENFKVRSRERA